VAKMSSPIFSLQTLHCCICAVEYEVTCNSGTRWENGVCSMRCHHEKEWRRTLSILGKPYRPDHRRYDVAGYPAKAEA